MSEVDQCFYRQELEKVKSGIQKYSLYDEDGVKQQTERTEEFEKSGKWDKSPEELISRAQEISGTIPGFHVKEIYHGISPFVIFLIPQIHEVDGKVSDEAKKSQSHIKKLLPFLERRGLSNVNLWEGYDMPYPHYADSFSGLYTSDELQQKSSGDSMRFDPQYADKFMNFYAESDITANHPDAQEFPSTLKYNASKLMFRDAIETYKQASLAELQGRNRQIMSNILMRSEATPANAFNLILGAAHFDTERMGGIENTMQAMLKQQGISYVLLEDNDPELR